MGNGENKTYKTKHGAGRVWNGVSKVSMGCFKLWMYNLHILAAALGMIRMGPRRGVHGPGWAGGGNWHHEDKAMSHVEALHGTC